MARPEYDVSELPNQFSLIRFKTLLAQQAKPGHYLLIQNNPFYLSGHNQTHIEFIVPTAACAMIIEHLTIHSLELCGTAFTVPLPHQYYLLIAKNQGVSACIFYMKQFRTAFRGLVLLGSDTHFPFKPCPSRHLIQHIPADVIAALPLFEDWGIAHRLACLEPAPGCYLGPVEQLAQLWQKEVRPINMTELTILTEPVAFPAQIA